jgi:acyl-CoA thioesterase II
MDAVLADLLKLLHLEQLDDHRFRGQSHDIGAPQVFGGQVLGQALMAAGRTVDNRLAHSLHAYFLRRGDVASPIEYVVDRARDGGSFSSRRVVAEQHGRAIFHMAASFQSAESGIEHQLTMPDVPGPNGLPDRSEVPAEIAAQLHEKLRNYLLRKRPFLIRPVNPPDLLQPEKMDPIKYVWIKAKDALPDDPLLHQALFAYVSDYELLSTATLPHAINFRDSNIQMASLDHALWFHRSFRADEWLLFSYDSPSASASRGLARGLVFAQDGRLIASTAQEGLMRLRD